MSQGGITVREVSVGEVSGRESICRRTILRGCVSLGSILEELSVGELSEYQFISETFSEELLERALKKKEQRPAPFVEKPVESLFL